ncbi:unnamed protein product [Didymodactylos carnosus]|nr:unnamed protein product [Didymodactylos carnosus]CAF4248204.1 unnamed protein product [Didymodactylos carnosus]
MGKHPWKSSESSNFKSKLTQRLQIYLPTSGSVYHTLGDARKGLEYLEQALEMRRDLYKGSHPDVAGSLNNVGSVYDTLGDVRKGLEYKVQTLEMYRNLYKESHPDVAKSMINIGMSYERKD